LKCPINTFINPDSAYPHTDGWWNVNFTAFIKRISFGKTWGFHGGVYEEWCLLGCYAVWLL
jgi:hypothetical protein